MIIRTIRPGLVLPPSVSMPLAVLFYALFWLVGPSGFLPAPTSMDLA